MKPSPIEHPDSPAPVSVARPQRSPSDCSLEAASVTEHTGHRSDESSKTRSVEPSPDGEHTPDGRLLKGLVDDEDQADADSKSRNGAYHDYAANTAATCHAAEVQLCTEARTQLHYRPTLILMGHKGGVSTVRFSPNGEKIASCCMRCRPPISVRLRGVLNTDPRHCSCRWDNKDLECRYRAAPAHARGPPCRSVNHLVESGLEAGGVWVRR